MPRSKTESCSVCSRPMWGGPDLAAVPCCRECRRTLSRDEKVALGIKQPSRYSFRRVWFPTCEQCGKTFCARGESTRFCSAACVGRRNQVRPDNSPRVLRSRLDGATPGLSARRRHDLLQLWRSQGRGCAYCGGAADTVDHVVPLVRGGTNYEGNLVPACRKCNSSKAARTIAEWRHGRPAGRSRYSPEFEPPQDRGPRLELVSLVQCPICQVVFESSRRRRFCGDECASEHFRRYMRDKYRASVGLPVDPDEPSSKWQGGAVRRRRQRAPRVPSVSSDQLSLAV